MRILTGALIVATLAFALPGYSVEPAYTGQFGNAEEPATRPYKWLYRGIKSFFYHTTDQLIEGNLRTPALGTVQGLRGVRRGTVELGESMFRGGVFAPVPPKDNYKELSAANRAIEDEMLMRNGSNFLFSWYFFPAQKFVEYYPIEGDTKVDIRRNEARNIREARDDARATRDSKESDESDVERAQRHYIGERADLGNTAKEDEYRGNLLKLAR